MSGRSARERARARAEAAPCGTAGAVRAVWRRPAAAAANPRRGVSMHAEFQCTRSFHARGVSKHAEFPCTKSFHARGVSMHAEFPCTRSFKERGVSCTRSFHARGVSMHAEFQSTRSFHARGVLMLPDPLGIHLLVDQARGFCRPPTRAGAAPRRRGAAVRSRSTGTGRRGEPPPVGFCTHAPRGCALCVRGCTSRTGYA